MTSRFRLGRGRTLVLSLSVLAGCLAAGPAHGDDVATVQAKAEKLRAEISALRAETAKTIARMEEAEHELGDAVAHAVQLGRHLDHARETSQSSDDRMRRRVAALYRSGGAIGLWATLLEARDPQDLVSRYANMRSVMSADQKALEGDTGLEVRLSSAEAGARRTAAERTRATAVLEAEETRLATLIAEQEAKLASADAEVRAALEAARQRAAAAATAKLLADARAQAAQLAGVSQAPYVGALGACPVGPVHSFADTWLAPRSGGRQHQGTDVFAPWGSPAYAVVDGTIERWSNGGLGGIALWLVADNGDRFYYAHNASNVAQPGTRVRAGELIAYVGTTGNAETTPPHIHFEAHPGGGAAVNPYAWLAALCGS